jgi:streptomycin 6-kinase
MKRQLVTVPESLRAFGRWQREGEAGQRWLMSLPELVAEQCERWGLLLDGEPMHGGNGLAVPVKRGDEPLVLKVDWPDEYLVEQARALRIWDGRGAVLLVGTDLAAGALLLERLDSARSLRQLPLTEAVPVIGRLLRRLAVPAGDGFNTTWDAAASMRESLRHRWEAAGRPFPRRVLDTALGLAGEMAADRAAVMVNRDLHYEQVLRGRRERWLAVDPLALVGSIEYQAGQLLWTRYDEMAESGRLRWCLDALVDAAGMEAHRAYSWAILRSIDYWLWGLDVGFDEDPLRCRRIVEQLA